MKKLLQMRSTFVAILLMSACVEGNAQTNNWSKRIVSKTKHPLASFINPHVSDVNVLVIDGKRFEHVRGLKKFYLPVPQLNAIIFLVDEKDYSVTYHVFKMDTDEDIAIPARGSLFGQTIGSANPQDSIEKVDDGIVVVCNLDRGAKSTLPSLADLDSVKSLYFIDVAKRAIVAQKTIYIDKAGKVIMERHTSPTVLK
jgi:hypothetical protein